MKFKKLVGAAFMLSTALSAGAAEGFYAGVGVGALGADFGISIPGTEEIVVGQTQTVGNLDFGYVIPLKSKWSIGVGASIDMNDVYAGTIADYKFTGKEHMSVYVQPFYSFGEGVSVYGKFGYHTIKGGVGGTEVLLGTVNVFKDFDGFGYGIGLKNMITKNLYLQTEANWVVFNTKTASQDTLAGTELKVKATSGVVTIGYQF